MTETRNSTQSSKEWWVSKYKGFSIGRKMRNADGVLDTQAIRFENGILELDKDSKDYKKKVKLLKVKGRLDIDVFGPYETRKAAEEAARFAGRDPVKVIQAEAGISPSELRRMQKPAAEIDAIEKKAAKEESEKTPEKPAGDGNGPGKGDSGEGQGDKQ